MLALYTCMKTGLTFASPVMPVLGSQVHRTDPSRWHSEHDGKHHPEVLRRIELRNCGTRSILDQIIVDSIRSHVQKSLSPSNYWGIPLLI